MPTWISRFPARRTRSSSITASAAAPARVSSYRRRSTTEVVDGVTQFAKNIRLGPGLDTRTQMGPLVSRTQLERVSGFLRSGEEQGAKATTRRQASRRQRLLRRAHRARQHVAGHEGVSGRDLRRRRSRSFRSRTPTTISWRAPTIRPTGSRRASSRATWREPSALPIGCAPARCGSTATTSSTPPCPSAATNSRDGAARWATTRSTTISKRSRSARASEPTPPIRLPVPSGPAIPQRVDVRGALSPLERAFSSQLTD